MTWQSFLFMAVVGVGVALVTYVMENQEIRIHQGVPERSPYSRRRRRTNFEEESRDEEPDYLYIPRPATTHHSNRLNSSSTESCTSTTVESRFLLTPSPRRSPISSSGVLHASAQAPRSAPVPHSPLPSDSSSSTNSQHLACVICLNNLSRISTLTCGHTFHSNCLNSTREVEIIFFSQFRTRLIHRCPDCRTEYCHTLTAYSNRLSSSSSSVLYGSTSSSGNSQYPDCAICLEQLSPIFTLTCGHTFHVNCLNRTRNEEITRYSYLGTRIRHRCPYCRTEYRTLSWNINNNT